MDITSVLPKYIHASEFRKNNNLKIKSKFLLILINMAHANIKTKSEEA